MLLSDVPIKAISLLKLLLLERIMAKPNQMVHNETVGTSWLFNGFILVAVGWMFLSMAFSGTGANLDGSAVKASMIVSE